MQAFAENREQELTYVSLDLSTICMVFVINASFYNAKRLKIQLEYVLLMTDDKRW